jgi:hypothetical protein
MFVQMERPQPAVGGTVTVVPAQPGFEAWFLSDLRVLARRCPIIAWNLVQRHPTDIGVFPVTLEGVVGGEYLVRYPDGRLTSPYGDYADWDEYVVAVTRRGAGGADEDVGRVAG